MNTCPESPAAKPPEIKAYMDEKPKMPEDDALLEKNIIKTIYAHYGKPENILNERMSLYKGKQTAAGHAQKSWNQGGWQRGRLDVFVGYEEDGYTKTRVGNSWFFKTDGKTVKVSLDKGGDDILEMTED